MKRIKVYLAGKVSPNSPHVGESWREEYCGILSDRTGLDIQNLNPSRGTATYEVDEGDPRAVFGRDCFMIQQSDVVIVNLTDDISVGGSQEMLIAKYFSKPLLGIAPVDGKFRKTEAEIRGRKYADYVHPFVKLPCDAILDDIEAVGDYLAAYFQGRRRRAKGVDVIDKSIQYYIDDLLEKSIVQ